MRGLPALALALLLAAALPAPARAAPLVSLELEVSVPGARAVAQQPRGGAHLPLLASRGTRRPRFRLPPGRYLVVVEKPGYAAYSQLVALRSGPYRLSVALRRPKPPVTALTRPDLGPRDNRPNRCPAATPLKATREGLYRAPGDPGYAASHAVRCFADAHGARVWGYKRAPRKPGPPGPVEGRRTPAARPAAPGR